MARWPARPAAATAAARPRRDRFRCSTRRRRSRSRSARPARARAAGSRADSTAPVGLPGLHRNSSWQRCQTSAGTASRSGRKPLPAVVFEEVRLGAGQQRRAFVDLVERIGHQHQRVAACRDRPRPARTRTAPRACRSPAAPCVSGSTLPAAVKRRSASARTASRNLGQPARGRIAVRARPGSARSARARMPAARAWARRWTGRCAAGPPGGVSPPSGRAGVRTGRRRAARVAGFIAAARRSSAPRQLLLQPRGGALRRAAAA